MNAGVDSRWAHPAWLGPFPDGWTMRPLWSMFGRIKDTGHPDEEMLSVFRDHGVVLKDSRRNLNQTAEDRTIYQLVRPGWLVTNRMKAWQGSVGISPYRGIVSGHYLCFEPTHDSDHRYLNWLMRSRPYAEGYALISRGVRPGQAEIDNDEYRAMPILTPPLDVQRSIADYLDRETAKIDALIERQEHLVAMLVERRQQTIEHIRIKGTASPQASRPSGIDWLGDIPAHWECRPLWSIFRRIKDMGHPDEEMLSVFREHGVVKKASRHNLNQTAENRDIYQLVHPGWFLVNRMKAWQGSVGISSVRGITSGHYICFEPHHHEDPEFLNLLLRSDSYTTGYRLMSRGVRPGQVEIDNDKLRALPILLPPIEEQREIVRAVHGQAGLIDHLISRVERFLTLSREHRAALVTAAVTGQIDVTKAA